MKTKKAMVLAFLGTLCLGAGAAETVRLAGGGRLELGQKELTLFDAAGRQRASLVLRAEQLDARSMAGSGLAVVRDSATQGAQLIRFDVSAGTLTPMVPLPQHSFGVDSLCLFRDRQALDHLFVMAKDGQAEQWLVQGTAARLVRRLSMPLDAGQCQVDDATHTLYVDEPGIGTWAYEADSEAPPARRLLKPGARLKRPAARADVVVQAQVQTEPVARRGDVADDPAIWIHPTNPAQSRVLGTNKKQGLLVYDLQGRQVQFVPSGRLNNVDVRQNLKFGDESFDLAVASQRDDNSVVLYGLDGTGQARELHRFPTGFADIYGICLFRPRAGGLDVIVNDKSGLFRQFGVRRDGGRWSSENGREFRVSSQPEGCVADEATERLFIGEEKRGVWTLDARASQPARLQLVLGAGKNLVPDVEGMAIYRRGGSGWLIVSSQGDSSYVVLDLAAPYRVRGHFKVGFNVDAGIDGTADTDGLDVTTADLGGPFRQGMLVIQDGYKRMPDGTQNFKYVSWEDVARALKL